MIRRIRLILKVSRAGILLLICSAVIGALSSCVREGPWLDARLARAAARDLLIQHGQNWGTVMNAWSPDLMDENGIYHWQIDYTDNEKGEPRYIIVNARSGWARIPPAAYQRIAKFIDYREDEEPAARMHGGDALLVLQTHPIPLGKPDDLRQIRQHLETERDRLNSLAKSMQRMPIFRVRETRSDLQLIFGWQDTIAISEDKSVQEFVHAFTDYKSTYWIHLEDEL